MLYPFQRLLVYSVYPGTTTVLWDLHPNMQDARPYVFQLQRCRTSNPDDEWETIGEPVSNAALLEDTTSVRSGFILDCFYRVVLQTASNNTYVSEPEGCFGQLHRNEWRLATEILNKERLLFKNTAVPGVLLKTLRSGERCTHCSGEYVEGVTNSRCEYCYGTGYAGGYHAPHRFQAWQVSPSQLKEIHYSNDIATYNMSVDRYQARALGIPDIYNGDIWVDLSTAQRFKISGSQVIAQLRRVPLVRQIDMTLLPVSDMAYSIPIGDADFDSITQFDSVGCGTKLINHDYPTDDALQYVDSSGNPIVGATITLTQGDTLLFTTTTDTNGRWKLGYNADLGDYTIIFEKPGKFGTSTVQISVTQEELTPEEAVKAEDKEERKAVNYRVPFAGF